MRIPLGALSAYPDQVWFDPNRPGWLPYFIDTPTESTRKYETVLVGNPAGNTMQAGESGAAAATLQAAKAACAAQSGTWDDEAGSCTPGVFGQYGPWLIGGAAAVGFLIFAIKK